MLSLLGMQMMNKVVCILLRSLSSVISKHQKQNLQIAEQLHFKCHIAALLFQLAYEKKGPSVNETNTASPFIIDLSK